MPMGRKTGAFSETTGPAVRAAALRLIAQYGYAAVSMRQVAAELGMQAGALYLYTPDKQTLLFDLMKDHLEDLLAAWAAKKATGTPTEKLQAFCQFHIGYHIDRPEHVLVANMELRNLTPENFAHIEKLRRSYEDELGAILREGKDDGSFTIADMRLGTMAILAMLTGVNSWYHEGGRLPRERVQRIYWNMVRKAVGA